MPYKFSPSSLSFPEKLLVCEREVKFPKWSSKRKGFYRNFIGKLLSVYEAKGKKRVLMGLSGSSGSGKSVLAALCRHLAGQLNLPFAFEQTSLDAFHYRNSYLLSKHTIDEKGNKRVLKEFKGRHDTYDAKKLKEKLRQFLSGKNVSFPVYSRALHEPVEDAVKISNPRTLLLVEGQWIFRDEAEWKGIAGLFDFKAFIASDMERNRAGIIERHFKGGKTLKEAAAHYYRSDRKNAELVEKDRRKADEIIPAFYNV